MPRIVFIEPGGGRREIVAPLGITLMEAARQRGATVVNGVGMLVHQAALAFELWTGRHAPLAVMRAAATEVLQSRGA